MGLLDDAIREHLDLKRRSGADPAEIERAEREALGPVRRGPEEPEAAESQLDESLPYDDEHGTPYDDEELAGYDGEEHVGVEDRRTVPYDDEDDVDWGEPFDEEDEESPGARFDERFAEADDQPTRHMPLEPEEEEPFEEPRGAASPPPHPAPATRPEDEPDTAQGSHQVGDATVEYEVEAATGHKQGKGEDDVLEETPEFLQDTPDHDRLWFEQRPPRDFDFDG